MTSSTPSDDRRIGTTVRHRRYVSYAHAHYAGGLVDGAFGLGLFGDAATELCIALDQDEGLFAGYEEVTFLAPVRAGDVVEARAELIAAGRRSRRIRFVLEVVARGQTTDEQPGRAALLSPALVATTAVGTVVVP
ncbi:3-aminobutyryl-CoA ammonia-lyase [Nocardioides sp. BGMRC 2183]|nr:3-aminobutyryl-CoA ammonia-lyase [Nocardioides sp. BGMRC 2183]